MKALPSAAGSPCGAHLKCSCTTGGRFAMKPGSPIGWPPCPYESGTPMPPVLMPGERTGRLCHREANGRQRSNKGLTASAAALTAQSEQRPLHNRAAKPKKAGNGIPVQPGLLQILGALGGMTERLGGAIAGFRIKRTTLVFKMNNLRICRPRHQRSTSEFNERSGAHRDILCASDGASV